MLSDAIKKRAERFGDISQAAKAQTLNVISVDLPREIFEYIYRNEESSVLNDFN